MMPPHILQTDECFLKDDLILPIAHSVWNTKSHLKGDMNLASITHNASWVSLHYITILEQMSLWKLNSFFFFSHLAPLQFLAMRKMKWIKDISGFVFAKASAEAEAMLIRGVRRLGS